MTQVAGRLVAAAYFARFRTMLERLRTFPDSGGRRPRLGAGIRIAVVRPYVIFYRASSDEVLIVRVLHGRRRITRRMVRGAR
jgi:toxin ParE1/3/4